MRNNVCRTRDTMITCLFACFSVRIRQAMFPESMDDGSNVPVPQLDPTANTAVQRLSQPSQMVKNAVVDLINYQVRWSFVCVTHPA